MVEATVSFYVVKGRLVDRDAHYEVLNVNVDEALAKKVRTITKGKILSSNAVRQYDFNTADLNDDVLGLTKTDDAFLSVGIDQNQQWGCSERKIVTTTLLAHGCISPGWICQTRHHYMGREKSRPAG